MDKKKVNKKDTKEEYWGQHDAHPDVYANGQMFEEGVSYDLSDNNAWSSIDYKFNEKEIMDEMQSYVDSTYNSHYSESKFQATEFIFDGGHAEGFCIGNILKYAQRYGKKGSPEESRKDLQKVIHYAVMAIHSHDLKNQ